MNSGMLVLPVWDASDAGAIPNVTLL
jgi:hypothetical protein